MHTILHDLFRMFYPLSGAEQRGWAAILSLRGGGSTTWSVVGRQPGVENRMSSDCPVYEEKVLSARTEWLFLALAFVFLSLLAWMLVVRGGGFLTIVFGCLFLLFLFYSLNYRTLVIRLSGEALTLEFGVFTWNVELENIEACYLDDVSLWKIGGAGIHFTFLRRRYRASLNFLEHPRVVITLKQKKGPVREVAFSTANPEEVIRVIRARAN